MSENVRCNVCSRPGRFAEAVDVVRAHSNVRQFQHETFTVWRCVHCGSLHSKEDVDLDWYYAHYPIHNQELDYFTRGIHVHLIRTLVRLGINKQQPILDYGCGGGVLVQRFEELGFERAVGYDPYVQRFAARDTLNRQYDAVVSSEVIEHTPEPRQWLGEVAACVKPGGLVALTCPNASTIDLSKSERACYYLHQPYHRHMPSETAIRELGASCGLTWHSVCRHPWDRLRPAVSERFFTEYVRATGNCLDAVVEPPKRGKVFTSPRLMFFALYGYFFPLNGIMLNVFRKE